MKLGTLAFSPSADAPQLMPDVVREAIDQHQLGDVFVASIDPTLADTAAFCEAYDVGIDVSANCVIVEAKRADKTWYAACIILATHRADINGIVRKHLDARKTSFAPMDFAVATTGMEYGGITPIGLPTDWPIIVDSRVVATEHVIIGSGLRRSKILVPGTLLASLPGAIVLDIAKTV